MVDKGERRKERKEVLAACGTVREDSSKTGRNLKESGSDRLKATGWEVERIKGTGLITGFTRSALIPILPSWRVLSNTGGRSPWNSHRENWQHLEHFRNYNYGPGDMCFGRNLTLIWTSIRSAHIVYAFNTRYGSVVLMLIGGLDNSNTASAVISPHYQPPITHQFPPPAAHPSRGFHPLPSASWELSRSNIKFIIGTAKHAAPTSVNIRLSISTNSALWAKLSESSRSHQACYKQSKSTMVDPFPFEHQRSTPVDSVLETCPKCSVKCLSPRCNPESDRTASLHHCAVQSYFREASNFPRVLSTIMEISMRTRNAEANEHDETKSSQFRPLPAEIVSPKNIFRNWDSPPAVWCSSTEIKFFGKGEEVPEKLERARLSLYRHSLTWRGERPAPGLWYLEFIFHLIAKLPSTPGTPEAEPEWKHGYWIGDYREKIGQRARETEREGGYARIEYLLFRRLEDENVEEGESQSCSNPKILATLFATIFAKFSETNSPWPPESICINIRGLLISIWPLVFPGQEFQETLQERASFSCSIKFEQKSSRQEYKLCVTCTATFLYGPMANFIFREILLNISCSSQYTTGTIFWHSTETAARRSC
ncbi:hypothetical protein WN51_05456 [Melipona quadrifasciata]|uniref:Uncharacterized protein n=1 Tax=Melipona quadrifasciata TaxID=166423 RepID=A0A0N1IU58_9HYME|nr:hypothetical protein WN51_05456 [Melipona quadrifasciata]